MNQQNVKTFLEIPLDNTRRVALGAEQGEPEEFLHTLGDVLGIQCRAAEECAALCRSVLRSENMPYGKNLPMHRKVVREDGFFNVYPVANGFPLKEREAMLLRFMVSGAITMESLYSPGEFAIFHGSMLEYGNDAILLFGESGVGKSTTRSRWLEEGGTSFSDDAMLCFFDGNDFYARCLPTWSDWSMNGSSSRSYPVVSPRRVKSILWLSRGKESQYISPVPPAVWHAQMMSAMVVHSISPMRRFSEQEKARYLDNIWSFICKLDKKFQQRGLHANLNYPLMETLSKEFER